jgi:hypothetical protein
MRVLPNLGSSRIEVVGGGYKFGSVANDVFIPVNGGLDLLL